MARREDDRFLRGRGSYVADLHLPGMLYAAFLTSPYAHAEIRSIDPSQAEKLRGVRRVLTAADLKGRVGAIATSWVLEDADMKAPPRPPLATGKVLYGGEALAVVVADDPYVAEDALEGISVDYEPLPAVVDQEEALKPGAPQLHNEVPNNRAFRWLLEGGDVEAAFGQADAVVQQRMVNQRVQPGAMEPRATMANWDPVGERLTLWLSCQNPHDLRAGLGEVLNLPERKVRVISGDVGGGFGSKAPVYPTDAVIGHLAMEMHRPVRWVESRTGNFQGTSHGRDQIQYVEAAAKTDGTLLGLRVKAFANLGAFASTAGAGIPTEAFGPMLSGCYRLQAVRAEVLGAYTNTTPTDAYRGAGRPEASYLIERTVDLVARKLSLDPALVRRRNFIPRDAFPYKVCTDLTYDSGDYQGALDKALTLVDYDARRLEQAKARAEGRWIGIGLSSYVEMCGFGPGLKGRSTVRVLPTGRAVVQTGGHPHGQGEETTFAQITADTLGIRPEDVDVVHGDTDIVPAGSGTYGSRTLPVEGSAVALASQRVLEKARRVAADLLEARVEDVVFEGGRFHVRGVPGEGLTLPAVAFQAHTSWEAPPGTEPGLEASATYDPKGLVYPFGTHVCVVEVEAETGSVKILRYVAVDDCGPVINPMIVEGQVHGGVVQGMAQALWEAARYDEAGNLLTSTFMEYLMPTAMEAPRIECHRTVTPSPQNPLGAKGVGEAGTVASAQAVVNAVVDALAPFGVVHVDMPLVPEKVWKATRGRAHP